MARCSSCLERAELLCVELFDSFSFFWTVLDLNFMRALDIQQEAGPPQAWTRYML